MAVGDTNVYILGKFTSDSMKIKNVWYKNKSPFGYSDVFITKIDRNGNVVWYKQLASNKDDNASTLVVSKNEKDIYFNLSLNENTTIDTFSLNVGNYLIKMNGNGKIEWIKIQYDLPLSGFGCRGRRDTYSSSIDNSGNYFNKGSAINWFGACDKFIDINNDTLQNIGSCPLSGGTVYVSSLDKFGNKYETPISILVASGGGSSKWKQNAKNKTSVLYGNFNIYDSDYNCGHFIVDGHSFKNFDTTKSNNYNSFIIKLDSNRHFLWAKFSDGPYSTNIDNIYFDANENVYCHGSYTGITVLEGITLGTDETSYGYFLIKYDKNGNFKWLRSDVYGEISLTDNSSNFLFVPNFGTIKKYDATTGSFISDMPNVINLGGDIKMNRYGEIFGAMNYTGGTGNCDLSYATKFNGQTFCIPPFGNDDILLYKINGLGTNVTAVKNNKSADIDVTIYPNPTTDKVKISTGNEILSKVIISNNLGQILSQSEIDATNFDVNLSTFPTGMYTITLFSKDGFSISKRILKN
ncbi:MAG TPA: T9SS type A sorting domain-containing protein [Saprospiraceae bacterium]|nr:T9SS type A sorting domain-containing protein [Saprospiraceae bacterium]